MAYDRDTFRRLAELRLAEAQLLVQHSQSSGAYYLAGYAIECALKARIATQFRANEIPEKSFINDIYTHDLTRLVRLAGLQAEIDAASGADIAFAERWSTVQKWTEQSRYEVWTETEAAAMITAVAGTAETEGFFQWLSARW